MFNRSSIYKREHNNVVESSIGIVFSNSSTINLPYVKEEGQIEEKMKNAVKRMKTLWRVDELMIIRDPSTEDVEKTFEKVS